MKKIPNYTTVFLLLMAASISFGSAAKKWIAMAPTIGWILTLAFLALACVTYVAKSR